jgi:hypothetical protein
VDWRREIRAGREPITQVIGRAAFEVGLEGLIVPSAADWEGHNFFVFPEKLQPGSQLSVLNAKSLLTWESAKLHAESLDTKTERADNGME